VVNKLSDTQLLMQGVRVVAGNFSALYTSIWQKHCLYPTREAWAIVNPNIAKTVGLNVGKAVSSKTVSII